jgi:uncharacterized protein DUF3883
VKLKPQNELALIVAYYLSRLDKAAHINLGYKSFNESARMIGDLLDVKPNTIKNMRDEFDYHLENSRIGWKRELRGSRLKVLQAFQMTDDEELLEIVREILDNKEWQNSDSYKDIQIILDESEKSSKKEKIFILRGPTGKSAENYYINLFQENPIPSRGNLIDCRDLGCGYDFRIATDSGKELYIEVKGLAEHSGGILFTDKEWRTARKYSDNYYLVIIRNVSTNPTIEVIQDPAKKLEPKRNIYTSVQVSWSVSDKALKNT